jgi:hypothetical protein
MLRVTLVVARTPLKICANEGIEGLARDHPEEGMQGSAARDWSTEWMHPRSRLLGLTVKGARP